MRALLALASCLGSAAVWAAPVTLPSGPPVPVVTGNRGQLASGANAPYCVGEYADDLGWLGRRVEQMERESYSYCVRSTSTYECLSYGEDGSVRRTRKKATQHGTAFAYRRQNGDTLLLTNQHVAEWPAVTDEDHRVEGVPSGCKRVADSLRIVDNESDGYDRDDIPLQRIVTDVALDAAVLRTKAVLTILPWKMGTSAAIRERNAVEVRGFPLGAFRAVNVGKVISAHDHDDERDWDHDDFVVDALLSAGNSGSPVLALSCRTGDFELVGMYHAGYVQGSALNVVVGIDQLRDLMMTLKPSAPVRAEASSLNESARSDLVRNAGAVLAPFFPFGGLTASLRSRSDGALLLEVFPRSFPASDVPLFAVEDLPIAGAFGATGHVWFGSAKGVRRYAVSELDADARAQLARVIDSLRLDGIAHLSVRVQMRALNTSRAQYNRAARQQRKLARSAALRRGLAAVLIDLADRLGPHAIDEATPIVEMMGPPPPPAPPPPPLAGAP